jgi:hypothetical protein
MEKSIFVSEARSAPHMRDLGLSAVWRLDMRHKFSVAFAAVFAVFPLGSAVAQVGESGYSLSLALALKAATKAIAACASNGYPVSAVVVDAPAL